MVGETRGHQKPYLKANNSAPARASLGPLYTQHLARPTDVRSCDKKCQRASSIRRVRAHFSGSRDGAQVLEVFRRSPPPRENARRHRRLARVKRTTGERNWQRQNEVEADARRGAQRSGQGVKSNQACGRPRVRKGVHPRLSDRPST